MTLKKCGEIQLESYLVDCLTLMILMFLLEKALEEVLFLLSNKSPFLDKSVESIGPSSISWVFSCPFRF